MTYTDKASYGSSPPCSHALHHQHAWMHDLECFWLLFKRDLYTLHFCAAHTCLPDHAWVRESVAIQCAINMHDCMIWNNFGYYSKETYIYYFFVLHTVRTGSCKTMCLFVSCVCACVRAGVCVCVYIYMKVRVYIRETSRTPPKKVYIHTHTHTRKHIFTHTKTDIHCRSLSLALFLCLALSFARPLSLALSLSPSLSLSLSLSLSFSLFLSLSPPFSLTAKKGYSTIQDSTTHCHALKNAVLKNFPVQKTTLFLYLDTHCWASQEDVSRHCNTLQRTATHCNALQHTATHCNTLLHLSRRM